jgi:Flp pilus assembly protein protease CpaA
LWTGLDHLMLFALVTSLAGGGLALGSLWYRRWQGVIDAHMAALGWQLAPARAEDVGIANPAASDGVASTALEPAPLTLLPMASRSPREASP